MLYVLIHSSSILLHFKAHGSRAARDAKTLDVCVDNAGRIESYREH